MLCVTSDVNTSISESCLPELGLLKLHPVHKSKDKVTTNNFFTVITTSLSMIKNRFKYRAIILCLIFEGQFTTGAFCDIFL